MDGKNFLAALKHITSPKILKITEGIRNQNSLIPKILDQRFIKEKIEIECVPDPISAVIHVICPWNPALWVV